MLSYLRDLWAIPPRDPKQSHRAATQLELFFDLIIVIAIASTTANLHHAISEGHGLEKMVNFGILFASIWLAWMNFTWYCSAFDPDDAVHRVLTIFIMFGATIFAAGTEYIFATLDFSIGILGWIIMRIGMILLWSRVALGSKRYRKIATRYAVGLLLAQTLWVVAYYTVDGPFTYFLTSYISLFLLELSIPIFAGDGNSHGTPWHREHVVERYGLLNIIVLGEVVLSVSLFISKLYDGDFNIELITTSATGMIIVFSLWWLYFLDEAQHFTKNSRGANFSWAYGHLFVYMGGALIGASLAVHVDVLTQSSHIDMITANRFLNGSMTMYMAALWFIRERFSDVGWRGAVLPIATLGFIFLSIIGASATISAIAIVITLILRNTKERPTQHKRAH